MAPEEVIGVPKLPPRPPDSNKGDFGRILVVAGSRGMSGAAVLCGSAALRGGAGLVRLAVPHEIWSIVAAGNPCCMTAPLPQDGHGRLGADAAAPLLSLVEGNDVLAIGPGLGRSAALSSLLARIFTEAAVPIVLDADGLNAFVEQREALGCHAAPRVLTPHPGEFARLLGLEARAVQAQRRELAVRFASEHDVILVLKGHATLVTDGRKIYQNPTGNAGMATAGSGDVLTGLVAALLGQGLDPFAAAQLGVHVHGLAGDLARDDLGEIGLIATDILDYIPYAFARM